MRYIPTSLFLCLVIIAAVLASGSYMTRSVTKERTILTSSGQRSKNVGCRRRKELSVLGNQTTCTATGFVAF